MINAFEKGIESLIIPNYPFLDEFEIEIPQDSARVNVWYTIEGDKKIFRMPYSPYTRELDEIRRATRLIFNMTSFDEDYRLETFFKFKIKK